MILPYKPFVFYLFHIIRNISFGILYTIFYGKVYYIDSSTLTLNLL